MSDPLDTPATEPATPRPDPGAFQLRGDPPRVMRLSRKVLAVIGVAAGLGIGGSLIYALKPAGEKEAKELYSTESRATSETITSGPRDYGQAPKLGPPLPGDLGGPIVSAQQRGENVPVPPVGAQAEEAARQRAQQERDAARMSSVFLGGSSAGAGAMPSLPNLAASRHKATRPPSAPSWRRHPISRRLASSASWRRSRPISCRRAASCPRRSSPASAPTFPARSPPR